MAETVRSFFIARQVSRRFQVESGREVTAVDQISLELPEGSWTALIGPSGSGKSTLLAMLGTLLPPSSGQVLIAGEDPWQLGEAGRTRLRRRLGFVFQKPQLLPRWPVGEGISYGLIPLGVSPGERRRRAQSALDAVGLSNLAERQPNELSGGEQQRVALARAILADPAALLCDEPTSQLDERNAQHVIELLTAQHRAGRTLLIATHDPRIIAQASHRVCLSDGRLIAQES